MHTQGAHAQVRGSEKNPECASSQGPSTYCLKQCPPAAALPPGPASRLLALGYKCYYTWLFTSVLGIQTWALHEHLPNSAASQVSDPELLSFRIMQQRRAGPGSRNHSSAHHVIGQNSKVTSLSYIDCCSAAKREGICHGRW